MYNITKTAKLITETLNSFKILAKRTPFYLSLAKCFLKVNFN
jgi:hypothetical protein